MFSGADDASKRAADMESRAARLQSELEAARSSSTESERRLREELATATARSNRAVAEVARAYGVSWGAVHRSLVAAAARWMPAPAPTRVLGIDVKRMVLYTFLINALLAVVAALLIAPTYLAKFDMGDSIGQKAFFAAIVGGFNQTRGALLGGVLIGVLENLVGFYVSPAYKEGVALVLFLVVILFRPEGLLGKAEERKV